MGEVLDTLRPGDILTHCFSGAPNNAGKFAVPLFKQGSLRERRPAATTATTQTARLLHRHAGALDHPGPLRDLGADVLGSQMLKLDPPKKK